MLTARKKLEDKICEQEKIIDDFPRFRELANKSPMSRAEREELKKLTYLAEKGIFSDDDVSECKNYLEKLRVRAGELEAEVNSTKAERDRLTDFYDTYTQQVQNDSEFLLAKAKEEQERQAQAGQIEEYEQERKIYYEK